MSAQDKQLLLRRSLQSRILNLARVARKSDVLGAISKVESDILAGVLQIMKYSDAPVDTAQMSLPVRLGGLGIHLMSDQDGAASDAAYLAAAALAHSAVSASSEHLEVSKVLLELSFQPCGPMCMIGLCHACVPIRSVCLAALC